MEKIFCRREAVPRTPQQAKTHIYTITFIDDDERGETFPADLTISKQARFYFSISISFLDRTRLIGGVETMVGFGWMAAWSSWTNLEGSENPLVKILIS